MVRKALYIAAILFPILLGGCRPTPLWFVTPEGPAEYQLGWHDGCDSGMSAVEADYLYRLIYGYKRRPEMAENNIYKQGWDEGFTYCRLVVDATQK